MVAAMRNPKRMIYPRRANLAARGERLRPTAARVVTPTGCTPNPEAQTEAVPRQHYGHSRASPLPCA